MAKRHRMAAGRNISCFALCLLVLGQQAGIAFAQSEGPNGEAAVAEALKDIPKQLHPVMLRGDGSGPVTSNAGNYKFQFHWAITTCTNRLKWGRMLTSTLLSGLLNGLQPASISLVYCRPYNPETIPALLYNLRNSRYVNMFFPPNITLPGDHPRHEAYWLATESVLLVPTMLGAPELPLLMTEDDILFAPDAHVRIDQAIQQANQMSNNEPYYLNLYMHVEKMALDENTTEIPQNIAGRDKKVKVIRRTLTGFQAAVFNRGMVDIFLKKFTEMLYGKFDDNYVGWSDEIVRVYLIKLECNKQGSGCHAFMVEPSVVQHVGTASTTHPKKNTKFHVANSFPVEVAFNGLESDTLWR